MADIKFKSAAHRDFFLENMMKSRVNDCYHRAFFYVMGIASETRANINQMFDFKTDCIVPEGMHGGWQTSGTVKVCHLAFNLWNGYAKEGRERFFTPEELFCCEFAPYLWRALRSGIPNIAGNFPHQSSRQTMFDNEIPYGHTIMPIKWAGTKKGAINEKI